MTVFEENSSKNFTEKKADKKIAPINATESPQNLIANWKQSLNESNLK